MSAPLVVLSDLHLSHGSAGGTAVAFAELLSRHAGHEIVLGGDVFGLSSDPRSRDPVESVCSLLAASPTLVAAMRAHLAGGSPLTLIAGNHDAALTTDGMRAALLSQLDLTDGAPLTLEPWFIRRGAVHVEHGHVWDPDNAPSHPLAPWSPRTEPLGIQLTRRFVAEHEVWEFAHAHETTLVDGLRRAYKVFGVKTPALVARYFATSSKICAETLFDRGLERERALGAEALRRQAESSNVDADSLRALLAEAPRPTHVAFKDTFLRLYFDRVFSAVGIGVGALWMMTRLSPVGMALAAGSGAYWSLNVRRSGSRYSNQPVRLLREGAEVVAQVTGAELVVFGHTHVPELGAHYANAGSFGYPARGMGRPYLVLPPGGAPELRRHG